MAASRNRLFAGFANNVVDNDNSITLDSAIIGNIDITDNSIMGTVGGGGVLNIGVNGIPGIKLFNPGAGPDYVGLTRNGGLKLYTTSTGVRISNSGDEFFAPGGSLIADSATLTNLTLNGDLVDSAWVAARGGGGGGCAYAGTLVGGSGGSGGGGAGRGTSGVAGIPGTANTGGGGGGSETSTGGVGGSGVVILRMPTANYSGTTTGSPTVSTSGSDTILVYNSTGTYTA